MSSLFELRDRISMLPSLESRLQFLSYEIKRVDVEVSKLLRQYRRECRDVERMQKEVFSSFLFKLVGKYETKMEKEQREEIAAKLAYDKAVTHLNSLVSEREEVSARILALQTEKQAYQIELDNRRGKFSGQQLTGSNGIQYAMLENERNSIISQITEIKEALNATNRVKSTAKTISKELNNADTWATIDIFTRGNLLQHAIKYSHIDSAEQNFHILSAQLNDLKNELNDVQNLSIPELTEISSTQRVIDVFFDNIFIDLAIQRQISDNANQITHLLNNINIIESALISKLKQKEIEFTENRQQEEEFLLHAH